MYPRDLWARASTGDLTAIRMLRDEILTLGEAGMPWEEALAQTEVMARLAASHGEPSDVLGLASVLLMRSVYLRTTAGIELDAAQEHLSAGLHEGYALAMLRGNFATEKADRFEGEAKALFPSIAYGDDPDAAALLVSTLSMRADKGDDSALTLLQTLMDAMPVGKLAAVRAALRNLEQEVDA